MSLASGELLWQPTESTLISPGGFWSQIEVAMCMFTDLLELNQWYARLAQIISPQQVSFQRNPCILPYVHYMTDEQATLVYIFTNVRMITIK